MAEEDIPPEVEDNINASLGDDAPTKKRGRRAPVYRIVGKSKIPVAKSTGKLWKARLSAGVTALGDLPETWSEAIRYYENDQIPHRRGDRFGLGNTLGNQRLNNNITETENIVFANVSRMVPALYSRNPRAEFTSEIEGKKELATKVERLINVILAKHSSPGVNLKPKAKRCVVTTLLTNRSWIKVGWIFKDASSEAARDELIKLSKQLEKAKDTKKIEQIEGKLMALEDTLDVLQSSGPTVEYKAHDVVVVDPNANEIDLSDANWLIEKTFLSTQFILARYAKENKSRKEFRSVYAPSHVLKVGAVEGDEGFSESDFSLFDAGKKGTDFGYEDEEAFKRSQMTEVCFVWDKVTRRVLLYNNKDWTWPIWVWDDPLNLDTFFPYFPLTFFESPSGPHTKGEVTYYLDQQDGINEMNDEAKRWRRWARRNVFYNKNLVEKEDVEAVLNGDDGTARPLNLPEGFKLQDVVGTILPPSIQYKELFDKTSQLEAIDRISSVGDVLRGAQFKTNTTNDAVQSNVAAQNLTLDEKSDQIEDWIGRISWALAQLCMQYMPSEMVAELVGPENAQEWEQLAPDEIRATMSVRVVGGSSKKPTSKAKKEEALELGQVLGQFVQTAPAVVLRVMLEVFQEAFDEVTIKEEDWDEIIRATSEQEQQGAGAAAPGQASPVGAAPVPGNGAASAVGTPENLDAILQQLPEEMKAEMVQRVQAGEDPKQVLQEAMRNLPTQARQ